MKVVRTVFSLCFLLFIIGCTQSKEEIKENVVTDTKQVFEEERKKSNHKTDQFSVYLPKGYNEKKTEDFNVLLEKGEQNYLLFVNENEKDNSQVSYEALKKQYDRPFLSETFTDKERFGYLFVNELDKNKYEVTVGIGGKKLTTEATLSALQEEVRDMMTIVSSVK